MALARRPRPVGAQAVAGAGRDAADVPVEHVETAPGQENTVKLDLTRLVEQAELDRRRMGGENGNVDAVLIERYAEWLGPAAGNAPSAHARSA